MRYQCSRCQHIKRWESKQPCTQRIRANSITLPNKKNKTYNPFKNFPKIIRLTNPVIKPSSWNDIFISFILITFCFFLQIPHSIITININAHAQKENKESKKSPKIVELLKLISFLSIQEKRALQIPVCRGKTRSSQHDLNRNPLKFKTKTIPFPLGPIWMGIRLFCAHNELQIRKDKCN